MDDEPSPVGADIPNARRRRFRSTVDKVRDFPQQVIEES